MAFTETTNLKNVIKKLYPDIIDVAKIHKRESLICFPNIELF